MSDLLYRSRSRVLFLIVALSATAPTGALAQSDELPTVPTGLTARAYSATAGGIRWDRSTDDRGLVRGYEVERDGVVIGVFDALSYIDTSLSAGTTYHYRVVAIDNAGQRSEAASVTLLAQGDEPDSGVGPAAPAGLRAEVYSHTAAELFWTRPSTFGLNYEISRDGTVLAVIDGVSYFDDSLLANTAYTYSVVTIDPEGRRSTPSQVMLATDGGGGGANPADPDAPTGLRGEVYSRTATELFWERPDTLGLRYEISRDGSVLAVIDGVSYFDDSLSGGTTYSYDVVAIDPNGRRSMPSQQVLTTPDGAGPMQPPGDTPPPGDDDGDRIDSDGDGLSDSEELAQGLNPNDPDTDGDGVEDATDAFPNDATASADSDGDGVDDSRDAFPNDPTEISDLNGDGLGDNANPIQGAILSGVVSNALDSNPIEGATVNLDLISFDSSMDALSRTTTNASGTYQLIVDSSLVSGSFAITASRDGFRPTVIIADSDDYTDGELITVDLALSPVSGSEVIIEEIPVVHHLGDDSFGGSFNSQFQRSTEGPSYLRNFNLASNQVASQELTLMVAAKGVQRRNEVYINGALVGTFPDTNSDGSYSLLDIPLTLQAGLLVEGSNTFEIRSVASGGSDIDDFEFVNLSITGFSQ